MGVSRWSALQTLWSQLRSHTHLGWFALGSLVEFKCVYINLSSLKYYYISKSYLKQVSNHKTHSAPQDPKPLRHQKDKPSHLPSPRNKQHCIQRQLDTEQRCMCTRSMSSTSGNEGLGVKNNIPSRGNVVSKQWWGKYKTKQRGKSRYSIQTQMRHLPEGLEMGIWSRCAMFGRRRL